METDMTHDYLEDRAANFKLMNDIKTWWKKRGHNVHVYLATERDPQGGGNIHVIRTRIPQSVAVAQTGYMVG
jgi:hypothetical protein